MGMGKELSLWHLWLEVLAVVTTFFHFLFSVLSVLCCRDIFHLCVHWSVQIMLCQPNKRVTLIHLPWIAFQTVSLSWTKMNICMKHAVGLLILEDNIIFFQILRYFGLQSTLCFGKPVHWKIGDLLYTLAFLPDKKSLLSKGMVEFTVLPSNNSNMMSTRFSTSFPTAYYNNFSGFGNLRGSFMLLDPSRISLITILLSSLQIYYF